MKNDEQKNEIQLAELFDTTKQNISQHINNILKDGELQTDSVVKKILTTADDGKKYQAAAISAVERDYLETLKKAEKSLKKGRRITEPGSESGTSS